MLALGWAVAVLPVSAVSGAGLDALVEAVARLVRRRARRRGGRAWPERPQAAPVLRPGQDRLEAFTVTREGDAFRIAGPALERLVAKADLENEEAVAYLQEVIAHAGVDQALRRAGAVARRHGRSSARSTLEFA